MSLSVSPQIRVLALAGVLGALALALGMRMLSPSSTPSTQHKVVKPLHQRTAPHHARPVHRTATRPAHPRRASVENSIIRASGLPPSIGRALFDSRVVVVSLYSPKAKTDKVATDEARAGAEIGDAGFVPINVLRQSDIAALKAKVGVSEDPTVLVFRRPFELFVKLDGFVDKETVAQAATDARKPGPAVG